VLDRKEAISWVEQGIDEKWPDEIFLSIIKEHGDLLWRNVHHAKVRDYVARYSRGADVLDAGCSTGILCEHALSCGAKSVVGLDIEEIRLHKARLRSPSAEFVQADLTKPWPVEPESQDLIVCVEVFEHLRDQPAFLGEVRRALRPEGHIVLTTPNGARWFARSGYDLPEDDAGYHWHEPTKPELARMLSMSDLTGWVAHYRYPKVHRVLRLRGRERLASLVERIPPRSRLAMGLLAVAQRRVIQT
jgi:2-polyprenyl-3-methyl-5-hydroxy-6-metoxy-1,4-benzoquinol methylase